MKTELLELMELLELLELLQLLELELPPTGGARVLELLLELDGGGMLSGPEP